MTAVALIIITILIIYVLTRKHGNNANEEMPIRQQIYLEPLKSVTLLSNKLFSEEDDRKRFCMYLLHAIFTSLQEETRMFCHHTESKKLILDFFDSIKTTSRKTFDYDDVDLDVLLTPILDMHHKVGMKVNPPDILMPVFQSFQEHSSLSPEYYYKLVGDWFEKDYLRFSTLNMKFRGYIHKMLKEM